jgi:thiol-disulfide isomerase/thioredoxin
MMKGVGQLLGCRTGKLAGAYRAYALLLLVRRPTTAEDYRTFGKVPYLGGITQKMIFMKKLMLLFALVPFLAGAQGMKFEHGLSWKEVQAKAKAENKYIFMDCFTTWCGPCKYMTENIFPTKEAGEFYNANFINVKVQFDTTKNDNEEVKSWFKDMEAINAKYKIRAYPTYLLFNPDGEIVHREVGASPKIEEFVVKGKNALQPETQYYTQLKKYEAGEKDPAFLKKLATMAQSAYELPKASEIANQYINTLSDPYTKENIEFIGKFTSASRDKGFAMMIESPEKMDAVLGKGKSKARITSIIINEELYPQIRKINADKSLVEPDFTALNEKAIQKYPQYASVITEYTDKAKIGFYLTKKNWGSFKQEVAGYITKYGEDKISPAELNTYAWQVFENCKDMSCVTEALEWSKKSFKDKENPMFMDTYANILHKMGRTKEAIEVQEKAVAMTTDEASKKELQETLDKMKKGEKTWAD